MVFDSQTSLVLNGVFLFADFFGSQWLFLVLNGCSWFSMVVLDSQTSLVLNGGGGQCTQIGPKH